jgi:hypothetical protein
MKKLFLIGCLILTSACQATPPAPQAESTPLVTIPTPVQFASPTPTLSPPSMFTAAPVPLYFTAEFNADMSAWTTFQTGGAQSPVTALENDSLHITLASPNTWYYAVHNAHEYSSVFVSAKFSGSPSGSAGVICNYSEANGWYEFNLASDGTYNILFGQWLSAEIAQYQPILRDRTEYLQVGNLNYEIGLTCANNTLFLYINGKLFRKIDVTRYGLTSGKIGVAAASFDETPMNAIFDWVKVSPPE